ncbi:hypothetical protein CA265_03930 [Sphingobacteriaceae bacterium GW460-11-11-14-LB5]|nr:hypothetical protein CA265_03930 [Sphingobacteriaceae bacterium GW460-11-11-14-LB5]
MKFKIHYKYIISSLTVCLGFLCQETFAQNADSIKIDSLKKIKLKGDSINLPYNLKVSKKYYAGAASFITGDDMSLFRYANNSNMLAGRVAGLTTNMNSEEPGYDGSSLYIRGFSTYNSSSPNIIVDNAPVGFAQLDPLEIDQLVVLKDAAANAIYGLKGANKNIFVTTKRGVAYQNSIKFYSQFGVLVPSKAPNFLGAQRYMKLYNEALVNDGRAERYSAAQIGQYDNPGRDQELYPDVNWNEELVAKQAIQQKYNLTFSGGTKDVRYFVLAGYMDQRGFLKYNDLSEESLGFNTNTNFKRYNFRTNLDIDINSTLTVGLDLAGRLETKNFPGTATSTIYNNISTYPSNLFPMLYADGKIGGFNESGLNYTRNPYGLITRTGNIVEVHRNLFGTIRIAQKLDMITKGLSVTGAFSYYNFNQNSEGSTFGAPASDFQVFNKKADGTYTRFNSDGLYAATGRSQTQDRMNTAWAKLDYQNNFGEDHELNSSIGFSQSIQTPAGNDFPYVSQGFFANAHYIFKKKYVAQLNIGYNGSENLAPNKRYGFFPAVAAAWLINEEDFLKNSSIDLLKIRASYGLTGNSDFSFLGTTFGSLFRYLYADGYGTGASYVFGRNPGTLTGRAEGLLANPDITWETAKTANLGIDYAFLNSKLTGSVDFFYEKRNNILAFPGSVSRVIGASFKPLNIGIVNNKGFDMELAYQDRIGDFAYSVRGTATYAKNKIIYNDEQATPYDYLKRTGLSSGTVFGLQQIGFFANQADIDNSPKQTFSTVKPGDFKYKDQNGDKVIDQFDEVALGAPFISNLSYGAQAGLRFKNVDLMVWFQGAGDRSVNIMNAATSGFANGSKPSDFALNRWTPATAATADFPRLSIDGRTSDNNYRSNDFWIRNGKYLKLKNIEIGYNFQQNVLKHVKISNARFFISANNLYTWADLPDFIDPEFLGAGINSAPRTKSFQVGLNIEL